jgi:hypothetical protein
MPGPSIERKHHHRPADEEDLGLDVASVQLFCKFGER